MKIWKNSCSGMAVRYRKVPLASVVLFAVAFTVSCAPAQPQNNAETTPTTVASNSPSEPGEEANAKPVDDDKSAPSQDESVVDVTKARLHEQGIGTKGVAKVKGGSYPQYEVDPSSHLAKFDESKHSGGYPAGWDKKTLKESQIAAANYMTNIVLDNQTLNDYEANQEALIKSLRSSVSPKYREEFAGMVRAHESSFSADTLQEAEFTGDKSKGFRFVSDGKTPRIADLSDYKVTSSQEWNGAVYFEYDGILTMNVVDKDDKPYAMDFTINYGLTIQKNNGEFHIDGTDYISGQYRDPEPLS